jgi:hypothetical protein
MTTRGRMLVAPASLGPLRYRMPRPASPSGGHLNLRRIGGSGPRKLTETEIPHEADASTGSIAQKRTIGRRR